MRFMMIVKPGKECGAGQAPAPEMVDAVMKYRGELQEAGVLLDVAPLRPEGVSIKSSGGRLTVTDGPFAETREVIGGFWLIQVQSKAEAIEWAKRAPHVEGQDGEIEIRELFELDDFRPSAAIDRERAPELAKNK